MLGVKVFSSLGFSVIYRLMMLLCRDGWMDG